MASYFIGSHVTNECIPPVRSMIFIKWVVAV